jgi:hypothetical protein
MSNELIFTSSKARTYTDMIEINSVLLIALMPIRIRHPFVIPVHVGPGS